MFLRRGVVNISSTPKLEDHSLSAVRNCLSNVFSATLHIGSRSSIRNLRTGHAVVTGTHLSWTDNRQLLENLSCMDSLLQKSFTYRNICALEGGSNRRLEESAKRGVSYFVLTKYVSGWWYQGGRDRRGMWHRWERNLMNRNFARIPWGRKPTQKSQVKMTDDIKMDLM
jgi:hypothetical protein